MCLQNAPKSTEMFCKSTPAFCSSAAGVSGHHATNKKQLATHQFNGPLPGTTRVSRYQKGKTISILLKQEAVASAGPYASLHLAPDR